MSLSNRKSQLLDWIEHVTSSAGVDALVADGWSRPMASEGLRLHKATWDIDRIAAAAEAEAEPFGGLEAMAETLPKSVLHIWPALPGGGVTPLIFGALAGIELYVRPASRLRTFPDFLVDSFPFAQRVEEVVESEAIVVSGSDETIAAVRETYPTRHVVGYGHRVSFAISDGTDAAQIARDIVMWNQMGCFSVRGVFVFPHRNSQLAEFASELAEEVAKLESEWDTRLTEGELARRVQSLGTAEFATKVYRAKFGWVQHGQGTWSGDWISTNAVRVSAVESPDQLRAIVEPGTPLQGVSVSSGLGEEWREAAKTLGATLVADSGTLQSPPPDWEHDGMPNLRVLAAL